VETGILKSCLHRGVHGTGDVVKVLGGGLGGADPPFVVASDRIRHEDVGPNVFLVDHFTEFPREAI